MEGHSTAKKHKAGSGEEITKSFQGREVANKKQKIRMVKMDQKKEDH